MATIINFKAFKEIADQMPKIWNFAKISVYNSLDNDNYLRMIQGSERGKKKIKKKTHTEMEKGVAFFFFFFN